MKGILVFLLVTALYSCSKEEQRSPNPPVEPTLPMPVLNGKTYLALGDSYTIGQSVQANERFPAQTTALLRQQGIAMQEPVYIATTGWTTGNLQNAIATQNPSPTYDVVSLLIGVNDQYQRMDTAGYAIRFAQLLEKSVQLAKGLKSHVFVLSIPDYSVTPYVPPSEKDRVRKEVHWFNAINRRITEVSGIDYTDITPSTRQAESNPSLIAFDGLHPSGLEYQKWAELLAPKMKAVLQ